MKRRILLFFAVIIIQVNFCFSQWHQLQSPLIQAAYPYSCGPGDYLPLSNGKILFAGGCGGPTPSSGNYINLYMSNNDLGNYNCALCSAVSTPPYVYSGQAALYDMTSYNDSTFDYIIRLSGWQTHVSTNSNFHTIKAFQYPGNSAKIGAHFTTNNYVYALSIQQTTTSPTTDTLAFVRTAVSTPTSQVYIKLPKYTQDFTTLLYIYNNKMLFLNDSTGYFLTKFRSNTSKSVLVRVNNYGNSFSDLIVDSVKTITNYSFPSINTGYITKSNGTIFKTVDAGINWISLSSPTGTINSIKFGTDNLGYIAGNSGQLWKTTDGGANWLSEVSTTTNNIISLYTFNNVAYFVDAVNNIYKNQANVVGLKETALNNSQINVYPNPANEEITIDLSSVTSGVEKIKIVSILGQTLQENAIEYPGNATYQLSVKNLSPGTYFIILESGKESIRKKICIMR